MMAFLGGLACGLIGFAAGMVFGILIIIDLVRDLDSDSKLWTRGHLENIELVSGNSNRAES